LVAAATRCRSSGLARSKLAFTVLQILLALALGAMNMGEAILSRITADPKIIGGRPIIRGMRISVELILSLLAQGESVDAIIDDYPELEPADIRACIAYAHA
jgi:uncharacterized protein (DUF433 family)